MTRRELLALSAAVPLLAQPRSPDIPRRIATLIQEYEQQGFHRTATAVDRLSGDWLMAQVRNAGLEPAREIFSIRRIDPIAASISAADRRIDGLPLFDCTYTGPDGIRGRIGPLGSGAEIGLAEAAPNTAEAGPLGDARRANHHRAIVLITRGRRPGLCPNNAESFLHPFGPPAIQVSSQEKAWLTGLTGDVHLLAVVTRAPADAFNVIATIRGADSALPPLVIMTPRSGWYTCASERGGGIACWLELMRSLRQTKPARDVLFVASSGHELGQRGIEIYAERRPELIRKSQAWIHFGANIGAAQEPGINIQASDDEMESLLAQQLDSAALTIDRRVPRGAVPGGEAGVVHRGGGRYVSIIGRSALFHNPDDRGPTAVDPEMIARIAAAFTLLARQLAA